MSLYLNNYIIFKIDYKLNHMYDFSSSKIKKVNHEILQSKAKKLFNKT